MTRWERFLAEVFAGDRELIDFLQRLLGYGITKLGTEHKLAVLWGRGRNGKDTLLETLNRVLGCVASAVSTDVILSRNRNPGSATPNTYALRELRIAWASETNEEATLDAGRVKHLTGGGSIVARPLYGSPVTFQPGFLLMLMTNYKPRAGGTDFALWKRVLLIPFTQSFVEEPDPENSNEHKAIPNLVDRLAEEAPGVLAWLVRGCLDWQEQGLNPPDVVKLATKEYQQGQDTIEQFIEEECTVFCSNEVKTSTLYAAYRNWAKSSGIRPMSRNAFGREMTHKPYERDKRNNGWYYLGLSTVWPRNEPEK
jgi:putative DNA primase/helicase